jgi:uncharacterized membrane protein YeaQ/YmgE (transglycosylase-associated protein family)
MQVPEPNRVPSVARKLLCSRTMTLGIAILWISIGAAVGWFGSRIMGTFARSSALANISLGILGAVMAGFITQRWLAVGLGTAGVILGLGGALLGSWLVIFSWQAFSRPKA